MQELIITVLPTGETKIEVKGVKGQGCKALTKDIEKALGHVTSDKPTAELYEREVNRVASRNRG